MGYFSRELVGILHVDDIGACGAFYRDALGLPVLIEWDRGPEEKGFKFQAAGGILEVLYEKKPAMGLGPGAIWLQANDIDGLYHTLRTRGDVRLVEDINDTSYGARVFQAADPQGNLICFCAYSEDVAKRPVPGSGNFGVEFRTVLYVEDLAASHRFYTQLLGLECVYKWDDGPNDRGYKYVAAAPGTYIEILNRRPPVRLGGCTVMIEARDVDQCYEAVGRAGGADIVTPIFTTHYGSRVFELGDPDRNVIRICGYGY